MKLFSSDSVFVTSTVLLLLTESIGFAAAAPKAPWVKQRAKGQARRALSAAMEKRDNTTLCAEKEALLTTAPKANVWGGLSGEEASSIVHWLFAQPELNLTKADDAGSWDNTL
jgi:primary-amine oxidase